MFNSFKSILDYFLGSCKSERTRRGYFIAIEGIDGIGKTTLAHRLVQRLRNDGIDAEYMSFPRRTTSTGELLDGYLRGESDISRERLDTLFRQNRTEAISYIDEVINEDKRTIVCDRFWMSGVAYSMARGLSKEECIKNEHHRVIEIPDVTIILDGVDAALKTLREKSCKEVTENEDFLREVSKAYSGILKHMGKDNIIMYNIPQVGGIVDCVYRDIIAKLKEQMYSCVSFSRPEGFSGESGSW